MKGLKWLNQHSRLLALASVLSLLLSFLLCFIQAKNASAIEYNVNLKYIKTIHSGGFTYSYRYGSGSLQTSTSTPLVIRRANDTDVDPAPDSPAYIVSVCTNSSYSFQTDDIVLITINGYIENTNQSIGGILGYFSATNFDIIQISQQIDDDNPTTILKYGLYQPGSNFTYEPYAVEQIYYPFQSVSYEILLKAKNSGTFPVCLGGQTTNNLFEIPKATTVGGFRFIFRTKYYLEVFAIDDSSEQMNDKDEEDRDNLENQKSESQDSSDDSQEEAESTGTTLLAAFSSFVTAITNASPSNCNLLMNMGNLNLGNVNLCQLSPPPAFQAIASIFMILFCVPLSIATARKVIDLFRSFQT